MGQHLTYGISLGSLEKRFVAFSLLNELSAHVQQLQHVNPKAPGKLDIRCADWRSSVSSAAVYFNLIVFVSPEVRVRSTMAFVSTPLSWMWRVTEGTTHKCSCEAQIDVSSGETPLDDGLIPDVWDQRLRLFMQACIRASNHTGHACDKTLTTIGRKCEQFKWTTNKVWSNPVWPASKSSLWVSSSVGNSRCAKSPEISSLVCFWLLKSLANWGLI